MKQLQSIKMLLVAALFVFTTSAFAQHTGGHQTEASKQSAEAAQYSCPMHPDVTSDKEGKCSKCGMKLVKKEKQATAYACPMKCEGDKTYENPGKCPKCKMNLTPVAKDKMKSAKTYACPMHADVTSTKPGKCSKCNMDLKEKKEDHSGHKH